MDLKGLPFLTEWIFWNRICQIPSKWGATRTGLKLVRLPPRYVAPLGEMTINFVITKETRRNSKVHSSKCANKEIIVKLKDLWSTRYTSYYINWIKNTVNWFGTIIRICCLERKKYSYRWTKTTFLGSIQFYLFYHDRWVSIEDPMVASEFNIKKRV